MYLDHVKSLEIEEAKEALVKSVPDLDIFLKKGQIEIIPYTPWYLKEDFFNSEKMLNFWAEKLNKTLANGYDGLRLSRNIFRVGKSGRILENMRKNWMTSSEVTR